MGAAAAVHPGQLARKGQGGGREEHNGEEGKGGRGKEGVGG